MHITLKCIATFKEAILYFGKVFLPLYYAEMNNIYGMIDNI